MHVHERWTLQVLLLPNEKSHKAEIKVTRTQSVQSFAALIAERAKLKISEVSSESVPSRVRSHLLPMQLDYRSPDPHFRH